MSLVNTIKLGLPDVAIQDVEDFLATDSLFVDYFNSFLGLPVFPEPLCFNKLTGGFEVVSSAKKDLKKKIKVAVESQKKKQSIYRVSKQHCYSDIPLLSVDPPEEEADGEIETSFPVMTLNKEQGIHWVKDQRLPAFLQSECYYEYRLAKILSQVQVEGPNGEYVIVQIDHIPEQKKTTDENVEVEVNPMEEIIKKMNVSMGEATPTQTQVWYSNLVEHGDMGLHLADSRTRPLSAVTDHTVYRKRSSGRPSSVFSSGKTDSGYISPAKSFFGSADLQGHNKCQLGLASSHETEVLCGDGDDVPKTSDGMSAKVPATPRPSDKVYEVWFGHEYQPPVYYKRAKSLINKTVSEEEFKMNIDVPVSCGLKVDNIMVGTIDEVGTQIVQKAIIESFAEINKIPVMNVPISSVHQILRDSQGLQKSAKSMPQFSPEKKTSIKQGESSASASNDSEEEVTVPQTIVNTTQANLKYIMSTTKSDLHRRCLENSIRSLAALPLESPIPPRTKELKKSDSSDADSLLDSDEDYEEQDTIFRQRSKHSYTLEYKKGVDELKKFIKGSAGESLWNLWMDIERSSLITDAKSETEYLSWMSHKYQVPGAKYELSVENRMRLGLMHPVWVLAALKSAQLKVAEPLILYWTTRFLLNQRDRITTAAPRARTTVPPALLPHRPQSCRPRLQSGSVAQSQAMYWQSVKDFSSGYQVTHPDIDAPDVLMQLRHPRADHHTWLTQLDYRAPGAASRRKYLPTALDKVFPTPYIHPQLQPTHKPECDLSTNLITPRMIVEKLKKARVNHRPISSRPSSVNPSVTESKPSLYRSVSQMTDRMKQEQSDDDGVCLSEDHSSRGSSVSGETTSDFRGGQRMDALLRALQHEKKAGGFFRSFLEKSGTEEWSRCLGLWHAIQDYHDMFYEEVMDEYNVTRKALAIFSTFIVDGAPRGINCDFTVRNNIHNSLRPPYEDVFDGAEETALDVLYEAWVQMINSDLATYSKVQQVEEKRHIETKSKFVLNLQKKGIIKETVLTPEDPMAGYIDPVYDPTLEDNLPAEFKNYTLDKLIRNRIELEHFREFLAQNYALMDLQCWMDIESFRRLSPMEEKRCDSKAKDIRLKYLNKKYFFGASSPAGKTGQDKVMEAGGGWGKLLDDRPPNGVILEAQKYVQDRLEKKWLVLYLGTGEFARRQRPNLNMDDIIDDLTMQKRRKNNNVLKLLESKWVSSSKEIIAFRRALLNPVTSYLFRRYVSIKGDHLENDVLFWFEVHKYKEIHQSGSDDSLIAQKIAAIIGCFIDSHIAPSIQIDITHEQAEKIVDRKHEKGPYLFRDAQLAVFRVLFSHWSDFCEYRSNVAEEKILTTIERRRKQAKKVEYARQRQYEEQERVRSEFLRLHSSTADYAESDPFADHEGSEFNPNEKDSMSWSYSHYMAALKHEQSLTRIESNSRVSLGDDTVSLKSIGTGGETKNVNAESAGRKRSTYDTQSSEKLNSTKVNSKDSLNG